MSEVMAYQERNIPRRPSPSAPPPPRSLPAQPPEHLIPKKPKRKQITKESLKKSQIITITILITLLVILFTFFYLSTILLTNEDSKRMNEDINMFWYDFNVPDILSQKIPVTIDVESSEPVDFYLLSNDDFDPDMSINKIYNLSISKDINERTHFSYEGELEPGQYVVVSYLRVNNDDITLDYKISRFVLIPFFWIFSLIFIVLISLCIVRILLLQKKSVKLFRYSEERYDYDSDPRQQPKELDYYDARDHPESVGTHESGYDHPLDAPDQSVHGQPYGARYARHSDPSPPPSRMPRPPRSSRPSQPPYPPQQPTEPRPRDPQRTQREPYPPPEHPRTYEPHMPQKPPEDRGFEPVTVPCKCGEVIVIKDPARPIHIRCPRCGRKGILEAKRSSPDDKIFY